MASLGVATSIGPTPTGNSDAKTASVYPYPKSALTHPRICVASVEGGIGAGKTTWIDRVVKALGAQPQDSRLHVLVAKEPIDEWERTGIFAEFLTNQRQWAALFQNTTYATRIMEWRRAYRQALAIVDADPQARVLVLLERSPFSDKHFFAELHVDLGNIDAVQWHQYQLWFNAWTEVAPSTIDFCIWVATSPDEAVRRIIKREDEGKRSGEVKAYDRSYLDMLHAKHIKYMNAGTFCNSPVLSVNGDLPFHECHDTLHTMCDTLLAWFDHTLSGRSTPDSNGSSSAPSSAASSGTASPALYSSTPVGVSAIVTSTAAVGVAEDSVVDDDSELHDLMASCKRHRQRVTAMAQ